MHRRPLLDAFDDPLSAPTGFLPQYARLRPLDSNNTVSIPFFERPSTESEERYLKEAARLEEMSRFRKHSALGVS